MDCLLAKAIPCVTDCVVAELEKLGPKYRVALRLTKDPRFKRLPCIHKGTYADDCLVQVQNMDIELWITTKRVLLLKHAASAEGGGARGWVDF